MADITQGNNQLTTEGQSPHINSLLSKLRPFQRDAFYFAVHGIQPSDTKNDGAGSNKKVAYAKRKSNAMYNNRGKQGSSNQNGSDQQIAGAGAGTGRILLGDEM